MLYNNLFGIAAGAGFSSRADEDSTDRASLAERYFGGLVFQAEYGNDKEKQQERATGRVFIGYAADDYWEWQVTQPDGSTAWRREHDRWIVDARLDTPSFFKSKDVKFSVRLFADGPASGDGPSDVRVSLLVSVDIGSVFSL
jgi:hypothetical protein